VDPRRSEDGQALPLAAGVVALVAALTVGLVALGGLVAQRSGARTAADAAALAGAARGRDAAVSTAARNHAALESFVARGSEVEVTVRVGDARATARARREW
jgi:hypothetical protein